MLERDIMDKKAISSEIATRASLTFFLELEYVSTNNRRIN